MSSRTTWGFRALFACTAFAYMFFSLLPFGSDAATIPAPEVMLCVTFAWILRRPDYVPVWLLVALVLMADVLLMRPLGLWTLMVLLASEYLRRRVDFSEVHTFGAELILVSALIAATFAAESVALSLLLAEGGPLTGRILQAISTIVFYPIVVVFSKLVGVRRLAPGELDTLGHRA